MSVSVEVGTLQGLFFFLVGQDVREAMNCDTRTTRSTTRVNIIIIILKVRS